MSEKIVPILSLGSEYLSCLTLTAAAKGYTTVSVCEDAMAKISASRAIVDNIVASGKPAYGITTGVGSQKNHVVAAEIAQEYNIRLVKGHATRVPGEVWPLEVVRGALIVLLNGYAWGQSGVSKELVDLITEKIGGIEMPVIDASGSVGASDLVPLAQTADWLLSSPEAVAHGLPKPKETLSLINCNAFTLAAGAMHIEELHQLLHVYNLAAATTMEGFRCNLDAISAPVNAVHRRLGQAIVAKKLREHLTGSKLWEEGASRYIQDPLSFRTISQVHGATYEYVDWLTRVWDAELNSVNDNPIINPKDAKAYSHGNMDTTRFTLALDSTRQAIAKMVDVSGERINKLQWPAFSGLPIGLAEQDSPLGGVQFLNFGHIAASLITSIKIWAAPHLLNSVGQLADGVEDTASHAMHSVHHLKRQLDACWKVVSLEIAVAVWAIHRRNLQLSDIGKDVREVYKVIQPLLPIGREGHEVFDLNIIVEAIKQQFSNEIGCSVSR